MVRSGRQWAWALLLAAVWAALAAPARAQEPNRAGLVVVHGSGVTVTRCVEFETAEISGYELLERAGLEMAVQATGMGAGMCSLDGEGCSFPAENCFCQCMSSSCTYWSYWLHEEGGWRYSGMGASSERVRDGDMQAWVWSEGRVGIEAEMAPPEVALADICAVKAVAATTDRATGATGAEPPAAAEADDPAASVEPESGLPLGGLLLIAGAPLAAAGLWAALRARKKA